MNRIATAVAATAVALTASLSTVAPAFAAPQQHIVKVKGDNKHGFWVIYSDGSGYRSPRIAAARRECRASESQFERVACRSAVRTQYQWMTKMRIALRHAG